MIPKEKKSAYDREYIEDLYQQYEKTGGNVNDSRFY